jgi:hypothetical protein
MVLTLPLLQNAVMRTPNHATKRRFVLPPCLPGTADRAGKQISLVCDPLNLFSFMKKTGAGEGIRTLDPNLGKVTKCLRRRYSRLSNISTKPCKTDILLTFRLRQSIRLVSTNCLFGGRHVDASSIFGKSELCHA